MPPPTKPTYDRIPSGAPTRTRKREQLPRFRPQIPLQITRVGSRPPTRQRRRCHLESSRARNLAAAPATIRQGRAWWCECAAGCLAAAPTTLASTPPPRAQARPALDRPPPPRARTLLHHPVSAQVWDLDLLRHSPPQSPPLPLSRRRRRQRSCNAPPLPSPTLTSCCAARSSSMRRTAALAGPRPPGGGGRLQPSRQEEDARIEAQSWRGSSRGMFCWECTRRSRARCLRKQASLAAQNPASHLEASSNHFEHRVSFVLPSPRLPQQPFCTSM